MNNRNICPLCGSEGLEEVKSTFVVENSFSGSEKLNIKEYQCDYCGAQGDLFNDNDTIIEAAINASNLDAINCIVDDLKKVNYSMSSIERAFSLSPRTISKWKSGATTPSKAGEALIKLIGTFPWLIEVAERNYDIKSSQIIHCQHAVSTLLTSMSAIGQHNYYDDSLRSITFTQSKITFKEEIVNVTPDETEFEDFFDTINVPNPSFQNVTLA